MPQGIRRPHEAVDYNALARMYPPPPEYFETTWLDDRETIEAKQLARVKDRAMRAYRVPFFRRRWDAAGFDPRSIESLADLDRIPFYSVDDIRKSIEAHPPLGDYQGVHPEEQPPVVHQAEYDPGRHAEQQRPGAELLFAVEEPHRPAPLTL